ncbi:unnamed protein product [Linum trigynum]|uniref:Uncharacterized protein n=1 Tax=Linum trigynum TaxID=586398 RepID=A0AAV2FP29_9ROSI
MRALTVNALTHPEMEPFSFALCYFVAAIHGFIEDFGQPRLGTSACCEGIDLHCRTFQGHLGSRSYYHDHRMTR